ncbi:molecular chaperone [Nostoc sp. UIC 10890]
MPVEIRVLSDFQLKMQKNNPFVLMLPVIELAANGNNIPYIHRVTHSVEGTPEELADKIQKTYKDFEPATLESLNYPKRLGQGFCTLNQPLIKPVNCNLQVTVEYFDTDTSGNPLLSEPKHIERKCHLYLDLEAKLSELDSRITTSKPQSNTPLSQSTQPEIAAMDSDLEAKLSELDSRITTSKPQPNTPLSQSTQSEIAAMDSDLEAKLSELVSRITTSTSQPSTPLSQSTQTKVNTMNSEPNQSNSNGQKKPYYPGWLAIDFGTSNSTVTLFDPIEVPIPELLPKEQQTRLLNGLAAWLRSSTTDALPGVNASEWEKFIADMSKNLEIEPSRLHEVFQGESQQRCLEAIRQIELCLGTSEQFRRAVSKKLYKIYHEVFRVPTLESQNLIPVLLDIDTRSVEILSELEITSLTPLGVMMGTDAKDNKNKAISQSTSNSSEEIISRFHHSPKRYFGQEREFSVTLEDGKQGNITASELIKAAWGHLIELTDNYRKHPSRSFSKGEFQMAVVTYPTIAPPLVRNQVKQLVEELGIKNVQTAYDEAVAVVMFFLWREFGGYLNIGIESFKTRCRRKGHKWSQNVLVLDIGGGTTDLALIDLTLEDITPSFTNNSDRGLGGRYYQITPKLLGSSGHLQLGGELITLRIFRLLKVAIVDCLLIAITTGELQNDKLKDLILNLDERFLEKDEYKQRSLLECIDKQYPERESAAYKDALNTAEKVLSTHWKDDTKRLQTFYTLWDHAEAAKLKLGQKPPQTFTLSEDKISDLLKQTGIDYIPSEQNFNKFSVTLNSEQFERAAFSVIKEAIGIAKGLMESRLNNKNDNQENFDSETQDDNQENLELEKEKVDWLILSGKTCNLDIVQREIYQEFSKSDYFIWNPERITFAPEFTKLATSAGACYAEKMRQFEFGTEKAKPLLRKGSNQLRIDVQNLFYYLPCNFKRKTQGSSDFLDIFQAGQELYQISPNDKVAKVRSKWEGIQLSNIIYRQDYEGGQLQLWGSFDGNSLLQKLNINEATLQQKIQIQFEIDSTLYIQILLCQKEPHYLIDDRDGDAIDVTQVTTATNANTEISALFSSEKLNHGDIAFNVLESNAVDRPNDSSLVFEAANDKTQFKQFHYSSDSKQPPVKGLISKPFTEFPESGKHTFYIYDINTETNQKKWLRIGELSKPSEIINLPCQYRVSLDEKGILRLHVGEVPYWESGDEQCLKEEGWVCRTELYLQPNEVDKERDPFCGVH